MKQNNPHPNSPQKIRITTYSLNKNWHTDNSSQEVSQMKQNISNPSVELIQRRKSDLDEKIE